MILFPYDSHICSIYDIFMNIGVLVKYRSSLFCESEVLKRFFCTSLCSHDIPNYFTQISFWESDRSMIRFVVEETHDLSLKKGCFLREVINLKWTRSISSEPSPHSLVEKIAQFFTISQETFYRVPILRIDMCKFWKNPLSHVVAKVESVSIRAIFSKRNSFFLSVSSEERFLYLNKWMNERDSICISMVSEGDNILFA